MKFKGLPNAETDKLERLSVTPNFCAYPNENLSKFILNSSEPEISNESNQPFDRDLSAGKEDPIYFAHYYSTKVPPEGIVPLILHYTKPDEVVVDAFCGTGMTGIAAQMCDSQIIAKKYGGKAGRRRTILSDLSPAATFIASVTNRLSTLAEYLPEIDDLLVEIETENRNLLKTNHNGWARGSQNSLRKNGRSSEILGDIEYIVWSDIYNCFACQSEISHWELVFRGPGLEAPSQLECPHCHAHLSTRMLNRTWIEMFDYELGKKIRRVKQKPVLVNYSVGSKRFEKYPDELDLKVIEEINNKRLENIVPLLELQDGFNTRQPRESHGLTHAHHFFSRRNLTLMSSYWSKIREFENPKYQIALYILTGAIQRICRLNRYMPNHDRHVGPLSGTLYVAPLVAEIPATSYMRERIKDLGRCTPLVSGQSVAVTTQSATDLSNIPNSSVDYIFVDPPFGANLNYSELNVLVEAWLQVRTNTTEEAIVNASQNKSLDDYRRLMRNSFVEFYRILKPNKWLTVEFHNSSNAVWNSIQEALGDAGFVIASVRILDKKKGTTKQLSYAATVKHDLMISAYKPTLEVEIKVASIFEESSIWLFINEHLAKLPLVNKIVNDFHVVAERQPTLLYERLISYCLRRGFLVPLSATEFYAELARRYASIDQMVFLHEQSGTYLKSKGLTNTVVQLPLFVQDEESAIEWVRHRLNLKPQTFQELQPDFMREIQAWRKYEERPELIDLLNENFLIWTGSTPLPSQIHSYLSTNFKDLRGLDKESPALVAKAMERWFVPDSSKAHDLEMKREKTLLKEFESYKSVSGRKFKQFRLEVLRAGFKAAWAAKNYKAIIAIAKKIPEEALQEDEKLLLWYDQALTRTEAGA